MKNLVEGQEVIFKDNKGYVRCSKILHVTVDTVVIFNPSKNKNKKNFEIPFSSIIGVQTLIWDYIKG